MGWPVMGIKQQRVLIRVPSAELTPLCDTNPTDCCGSGSGSGDGYCGEEQCTTACDICPGGMSAVWLADELGITLCHVINPDDGNNCRFITSDGRYQMWYDDSPEFLGGLWLLQDLEDQDHIWFAESFACDPDAPGNEFTPVLAGDDPVFLLPLHDCSTITYDCTTGGCVAVAGEGGEYATLEECEAACESGPITTACCPEGSPTVLYAHLVSSCGCLNETKAMTWNGVRYESEQYTEPCDGDDTGLFMVCIGGIWYFSKLNSARCGFDPVESASLTCSPFEAVFNAALSGAPCTACAEGTPVTVTVNTTP